MDFVTILEILENAAKRNEFILRLKSKGENSSSVTHLKNSMIGVNMHRPPKGLEQKIILQHTFSFMKPFNCFQNCRLVSKLWKNVSETMKYNDFQDVMIWKEISGNETFPIALGNFLKLFRKLKIHPWHVHDQQMNWNSIGNFIAKNMKKLNEIDISGGMQGKICIEHEKVIIQILKKFHKTLKKISLSKLIFPEINFKQVYRIEFIVGHDISNKQFENNFSKLLKFMPNLEIIKLDLWDPHKEQICKFLQNNYWEHCISASDVNHELVHNFPLQIYTNLREISNLNNLKFIPNLEYLEIELDSWESQNADWNEFENIFDQCINLKQIAISNEFGENIEILENQISNWKNQIEYFQLKNIKIVHTKEIYKNENLELKIAKKLGLSWIISLT